MLICALFAFSVHADNEFLVIDISAGYSTNSYPVNYYDAADLPGSVTDNTYKTDKILLQKVTAGTFTMGSPTQRGRTSFG